MGTRSPHSNSLCDVIQVEQIWCLLPAFFREPLDLMTGLADGQIINAMIGELDKPVIKDHVCTAIGTLCRHITPFLESDAADLPYDTTEFPFMQRMWHEISQNNPTALRLQSTKLMGVLTVKFLQAHRPTAGLSVRSIKYSSVIKCPITSNLLSYLFNHVPNI